MSKKVLTLIIVFIFNESYDIAIVMSSSCSGKMFFPPTFWPFQTKLQGSKVKNIKKWSKSAKFRGRFEGRLTFWPATRAKWLEIEKSFFPRNLTLMA